MATATKSVKTPLAGGQGKGGQRLAAAFDAVSRMPALDETVDRVLKAAAQESSSLTEITELVETDTAMAIAVMRSNHAARLKNSHQSRMTTPNTTPPATETMKASSKRIGGAIQSSH